MPGVARTAALRTFRSLRNWNYRLFWCGQVVSLTGTWMQRIALSWLVLQLTHSPLALGAVTTLQFVPILLLLALRRRDRRPRAEAALAARHAVGDGVQALTLAVLTASGHIQLWQIYILAGDPRHRQRDRQPDAPGVRRASWSARTICRTRSRSTRPSSTPRASSARRSPVSRSPRRRGGLLLAQRGQLPGRHRRLAADEPGQVLRRASAERARATSCGRSARACATP